MRCDRWFLIIGRSRLAGVASDYAAAQHGKSLAAAAGSRHRT
jgi:hypothetical protein